MVYIIAIVVLSGVGGFLAVLLVVSDYFFASYGECKIVVNEGAREYVVQGGGTLLSTLVENKLFVPSACGGKGTCGYCKVRVLSDIGPILPTESGLLTRIEMKRNVRLACQIKVKADIEIEVPEEYFLIKEFRTVVLKTVNVTHDIKEITLKLLDPPTIDLRAGKYVQVRIPREEGLRVMRGTYAGMDFSNFDARKIDPELIPNEKSIYRGYSTSNAPEQKDVAELVVKLAPPPPEKPDAPPGIGSCYIWSWKEGDEVWITGPYGDFLVKDTDRPCVFVGGGAGMAPMKAMILELFHNRTKRDVKFFYGARAKKDLFYDDIYRKLAEENENFEYTTALSEPDPEDEWDGYTGFIHTIVEKCLDSFIGREYYLCGPPAMIDACVDMLHSKGVPDDDIAFDKF